MTSGSVSETAQNDRQRIAETPCSSFQTPAKQLYLSGQVKHAPRRDQWR